MVDARAWLVLLSALIAAGCVGGSPPIVVNDARAPGPSDAGVPPDRPRPPSPDGPPGARLLVPGRARLVGTTDNACSHQAPASGDGHRWCAFSRPGQVLGKTDLWVIDVTVAGAAFTPPPCDGTDPRCLRLTDDLWTGQPMGGVTSFPASDRFDGDTLVFQANAPAELTEYSGPIFAWRPGWTEAKQISGNAAFSCAAHPVAEVYHCLENLTPPGEATFQFDLTAGKLSDAVPHRLARITPQRPGTTSTQWRVAYTRSGDHIAWSTGGPTLEEPETLFVVGTDDLADADARKITVGAGISRWVISADAAKLYFLRDFTYAPPGTTASGTLTMADFPTGAHETSLAPGVASLQLLDTTPGAVGFFDGVTPAARASFNIIRDDHPGAITTVVRDITGIGGVSRDLRFVHFYREFDPDSGTTDAQVARADGSGVTCTLATGTKTDEFGVPFTPNGALAFWVDNVDLLEGVGEGWVANPDGCTGKQKFADRIDFWFLRDSAGMIYSDGAMGEGATIRAVPFPGGTTFGTPGYVIAVVGRLYAPLAERDGVVFTFTGRDPATDGLYFSSVVF